ncbi:unnamed protein product [Candida verbasci]|uniref:Transcriptional regulator IFH1 n=1 Tax=Candida verbasci TaxID=1227364 RepID=A0A9W4TZ58_9ASCO|nr:unnamed protein product [Candida verbasci]
MSYGGKRKFSIAKSTSSNCSSSEDNNDNNHHIIHSDSDSSLTDIGDRKLLIGKRLNKKSPFKGKKKIPSGGKKLPKKKWVNQQEESEQADDNDSEEDGSNGSDADDDADDDLTGLFSLLNNKKQGGNSDEENNSSSEEDSDDDDEDEDEDEDEDDYDDDVDFVKLQAQKKVQSLKNARALKGLKGKKNMSTSAIESSSEESSDNEIVEDIEPRSKLSSRRKSLNNKFGRRKSNAALPDIKFEFNHKDSFQDEPDVKIENKQPEEEDMGEEINLSSSVSMNNATTQFDFEFDNQLMVVPKINEDELNSDEDYEIDDNELLATLQAENDVDEFLPDLSTTHDYHTTSQPHIISEEINEEEDNDEFEDEDEDEENDPFLKEEEKYLVNEFENNGFDEDDEDDENYFDLDSDFSTSKKINHSFRGIGEDKSKPIKTYEDNNYSNSDYDEDDYINLNDFDIPLFDKSDNEKEEKNKETNKNKSSNRKRKSNLKNSDEDDDDSYLWNYFFSSDNDSSSSDEKEIKKEKESKQQQVDDLFKQIDNDNTFKKKLKKRKTNEFLGSRIDYNDSLDEDEYNDSSESTDIDENIPKSNSSRNIGGLKKATEVLSSKTADYRPPILGSWVTIDSKPFGIIDGLSTRTLQPKQKQQQQQGQGLPNIPNNIPRKSIFVPNDDSVEMGLDELLNISELDNNDENDAKIWRDFNNHKKIPLGAFRNKSILQQNTNQGEFKRRYSNSNSNSNSNIKKSSPKSGVNKERRRQQSILEAVNEGYRPTKSGLFSENALADVEELLGDDNDIMALIKGL